MASHDSVDFGGVLWTEHEEAQELLVEALKVATLTLYQPMMHVNPLPTDDPHVCRGRSMSQYEYVWRI